MASPFLSFYGFAVSKFLGFYAFGLSKFLVQGS